MRVEDVPPVESYERCGKVAVTVHAGFLWQDCGLEAGHDPPCLPKNHCLRHGYYFGLNCPHWPTCAGADELNRRKLLGVNNAE